MKYTGDNINSSYTVFSKICITAEKIQKYQKKVASQNFIQPKAGQQSPHEVHTTWHIKIQGQAR